MHVFPWGKDVKVKTRSLHLSPALRYRQTAWGCISVTHVHFHVDVDVQLMRPSMHDGFHA
jgi:hypothetical protein